MNRRQLSGLALVAAMAALTGCASLNQLSSEVSSYGQWPPGRAAGSYFIERLPSQAAQAAAGGPMAPLELAAHGALQAAGFKQAASLEAADVVVQIGARVTRYDISPWADPLWWRWGPRYWRGPAWTGQRFYSTPPGWRTAPPPDREVAVLLRDRATSVPLWEARAVSSGISTDVAIFQAMFSAALSDFPNAKPQAHNVTVTLPAGR
ncbi:MAG: DUF4136 domain-containing protein [Betaproteobacteria bacterium]|jgi:hypothetical protein|nr:DUF4136 domain-containing protein [Betaproteobacteria bacterium]NBT10512.1 DUF4136 domain-containing protein [Betaproteobacteria bacterium]NBU50186.1 DUF4136 domain-containing protein [Betaproteobacteria bacterium]NBX96030.1 DUF4136 domain-containing protein [Betaproteobacteria bacterium]